MVTGTDTPKARATASASVMTSRATALAPGSVAISSRVARVRALRGLKAMLPRSFTQMSWRIRGRMGQRSPARMRADPAMSLHRSCGGAVKLADGEAIALNVLDDARLDHRGRGVDDAADDPLGSDVTVQNAVGVQAVQMRGVQGATVPLEVPPGEPVLGGEDGGVRAQQRRQPRRDLRQPMGLDRQDDDVDRPDGLRVVGGYRVRYEVLRGGADADAVLPHGLQVRPSER